MKLFVSIFLMAVVVSAQPAPAKTKPAAKKSAPAKKSPWPDGVPADATPLSAFEWRHVDKDGKAWIYKKTPFSVAKLSEEDYRAGSPSAPAPSRDTEVRDLGDSYEFTRKTPFNTARWTKKKTDLDAGERALVEAFGKAGQKEQE